MNEEKVFITKTVSLDTALDVIRALGLNPFKTASIAIDWTPAFGQTEFEVVAEVSNENR